MYINEAVGNALILNVCIKRKGAPIWGQLKVKPHQKDRFDLCTPRGCFPGWQPDSEDLMADDWILVTN